MGAPARDVGRRPGGRTVTLEGELLDALPLDCGVLQLTRCRVVGVDLAGVEKLPSIFVTDSVLEGCRFAGTALSGTMGNGPTTSTWLECDFSGADLRRARPGRARFERCRFDNARLDKWMPYGAEFVDCHFAGELREVTFAGHHVGLSVVPLDRHDNEFRGNDFRDAALSFTAFGYGIDVGQQLLPAGSEYATVTRAAIRRAADAVETLPSGADTDRLAAAIKHLSDARYAESPVLFLRRDQPPLATLLAEPAVAAVLDA